jgi:uncharacterized membrane protein YbhN (UPF0104 family)
MTASNRPKSILLAAVSLAVFIAAIVVLQHSLAKLRLADVLASLRAEPLQRVLECALFTVCSYSMLTFYDYLALRGVRRPLRWVECAPVSFIAFSIGHSVGLSWLSGGSVRYRGYAPKGLTTLEFAGLVGLISGTFALGVGSVLCLAMLLGSHGVARVMSLHVWQVRALGVGLFALIAGYLLLTLLKKDPIRVLGRTVRLPSFHIGLGQTAVAGIDLCFAAATLYVLLPPEFSLHFFSFVGLYVIAIQAGVLSNVPGGVGVFETVLIQLLPGGPSADLVGAVLLYRIIYYFIPLVLGIGLFAGREALR